MCQLVTRFQVDALEEAELQSRFTDLQEILLRTQRWQADRLQALASLETIEAALNRKRALKPGL